MGQYYYVVNVDKKEYLEPHKFGDGAKLLEFGSSGEGVMLGLAVLLALGNGRGGGDLRSDSPVIGSWAGDRVIIAGDYSDPWVDPQDLLAAPVKDGPNLYSQASESYKDISEEVLAALLDDRYLAEALGKTVGRTGRYKLPVAYGERKSVGKQKSVAK